MKRYLKLFSQRRGYSLIELIVAMGISMVVLLLLSNLLNVSTRSLSKSGELNSLELSYFYGINFIRTEVEGANEIIPIENSDYFGFAILNIDGTNRKLPYQYIAYRFKNNSIQRVSYRSKEKSDTFNFLNGGVNVVMDNVEKVDSSFKDGTIHLEIQLKRGNSSENYTSIISSRCL